MKFHYQYVSKNTVRIELITEDRKETANVETLASAGQDDNRSLDQLFQSGLENYCSTGRLTGLRFMDFPRVALCSFERTDIPCLPPIDLPVSDGCF